MDVKFYLRDSKKDGETPIYARISDTFYTITPTGGKKYSQVKIYFNKKIHPELWNPKKFRAREKFTGYSDFNAYLDGVAQSLKNLHTKLIAQRVEVTPELFKREWDKLNSPEPEEQTKIEFVEFAEKFIANVSSSRSQGTIKNYNNSLKHLKEFSTATNTPLEFECMGLDFHLSLMEYLKNQKRFAPNTIWRINKVLKMLLGEATDRKLNTNLDFKGKRFKVTPEEPEVIYLNLSDLVKLFKLNLTSKPTLERVRDLFLIGCYTGLRFSDYNKLRPENITEHEGTPILNVNTKKTGQNVAIPLHPIVVTILEKYNGQMPKGMSNQKFNEYLKQVAKLAGLTDIVTLGQTRGNLTVPKPHYKWELVTTHTARRSFATNAYIAKVPPISIMLITGHRTEKAFLRYIRIDGNENAVLMASHPFFNVSPLKIAE